MNLNNIISEIGKTDPEVYGRLDSRRSALKNFANIGGKIALTALPIAFGSMFKKAYAGTKGVADVFDVLNYALTLEYLEAEFYVTSITAPGLLSGDLKNGVMTISNHETAHVNFLKDAITAAGGTPVSKPTFDFSGGKGSGEGPFKTAFSDLTLFLAVAQTFEDTGVRAYKGRAAELVGAGGVLTAALQIHSVEARHAAHIRQMRRGLPSGSLIPSGVSVAPWITLNQSGIDTGNAGANAAIQLSYAGEEVSTQAGVNIVNIGGQSIAATEASEAFDEPLTKAQVTTIVNPFIV